LQEIDGKKNKLLGESKSVEDDCNNQETRLFFLNNLMKTCECFLARAKEEEQFTSGEKQYSEDFKTMQDMYQQMIKEHDSQLKKLKKEQKYIKENFNNHVGQAKMFNDLHKLLAVKLNVVRQEFAHAEREAGIITDKRTQLGKDVNMFIVE